MASSPNKLSIGPSIAQSSSIIEPSSLFSLPVDLMRSIVKYLPLTADGSGRNSRENLVLAIPPMPQYALYALECIKMLREPIAGLPLTHRRLLNRAKRSERGLEYNFFERCNPFPLDATAVMTFHQNGSLRILRKEKFVSLHKTAKKKVKAQLLYFSGVDVVIAARTIKGIAEQIVSEISHLRNAQTLQNASVLFEYLQQSKYELRGLFLPQVNIEVNNGFLNCAKVSSTLAVRLLQMQPQQRIFFQKMQARCTGEIEDVQNQLIRYLCNDLSDYTLFKTFQGKLVIGQDMLDQPYDPGCSEGEILRGVGYTLRKDVEIATDFFCNLYVRPERDITERSYVFSLVWTGFAAYRGRAPKELEFASLSFGAPRLTGLAMPESVEMRYSPYFRSSINITLGSGFSSMNGTQIDNIRAGVVAYLAQLAAELLANRKERESGSIKISATDELIGLLQNFGFEIDRNEAFLAYYRNYTVGDSHFRLRDQHGAILTTVFVDDEQTVTFDQMIAQNPILPSDFTLPLP